MTTLDVPQGVRIVPRFTYEVTEGMTIAQAIAHADTIGGDWTIMVYPGTYIEGDLTPDGTADITIKAIGEGRVVIAPVAAPVTAVIVSGFTLTLEDIIVTAPDATMPALSVTGGICSARNCTLTGVGAGDSIDMTAGTLNLEHCDVNVDIELSTAPCTLNAWDSDIYGGINTAAAAVAHDINLYRCDMNLTNIVSASTAGTTLDLIGCQQIGTVNNSGTGAFTIRESDVAVINNINMAGTVTIYGGYLHDIARAVGSVVWWQDDNTLKVIPCGTITDTVIQWAVDAAGAGDTVVIHPGTYEEAVTLTAGINLRGLDKELCIIDIDHAVLITMAEGCAVSNLTLDVTCDDINVGVGIELNDAACTIEDINIILHRPADGLYATGILEDTNNTAKTIYIRNVRCRMSDDTNERGIVINQANKTVYIEECWIQGSDYGLAIGESAGAAIASTIHASHNQFEASSAVSRSVFCNGGTIHLNGDVIGAADHSGGRVFRENAGVITFKFGPREYEVWAGMSIQDAITAAAAETTTPAATDPYTILIHPGIYDEAIICASWVNLKGIGPKGSVVIYNEDPFSLVTISAANVEISELVIRLGVPSTTRRIVEISQDCKLSDIVFECVTPATREIRVINISAGSVTIERCSHNIGGTGGSKTLRISGVSTVHLLDNDFDFDNIATEHIYSSAACTVTGIGNRWAGTGRIFEITDGTFTFDNDALICTAGWTNTNSIITLRNCVIEAPVVAGNLATVRMKNCSYRAISRTGTGNIVDEGPDLKDAPWHIERWTWQAALANAQVAVRGVPLDAGSGQVVIETLDSGAGIMAVETSPELARALGNEFTPARTPRFLTQISAHTDDGSGAGNPAFDPHVDMFFGLRQTLGNAVPLAAEHHAGFGWDNLDASVNKFWAISSDGVAQQITLLTTPSDDVHVQLEVIVFGGVTTVGWVEFYIDGVLVATHATRIPTAVLDWQHLIIGLGTGAGDTISVTVRNGGTQECPA